jgi:hypothetical protein
MMIASDKDQELDTQQHDPADANNPNNRPSIQVGGPPPNAPAPAAATAVPEAPPAPQTPGAATAPGMPEPPPAPQTPARDQPWPAWARRPGDPGDLGYGFYPSGRPRMFAGVEFPPLEELAAQPPAANRLNNEADSLVAMLHPELDRQHPVTTVAQLLELIDSGVAIEQIFRRVKVKPYRLMQMMNSRKFQNHNQSRQVLADVVTSLSASLAGPGAVAELRRLGACQEKPETVRKSCGMLLRERRRGEKKTGRRWDGATGGEERCGEKKTGRLGDGETGREEKTGATGATLKRGEAELIP